MSAVILVRYQLSKVGIATALLHGRNCGHEQTIVLQSPDYQPPTPPQASIDAIVDGVNSVDVPESAEAATAVLEKVIEVAAVLGKALNPCASTDIVTERADRDLWEMACEMARTDHGMTPFIQIMDDEGIRTDFAYWKRNAGYELRDEQVRGDPYKMLVALTPVRHTDGAMIDAPATAAHLLRVEKDRRNDLLVKKAEIEQQQAGRVAELDAKMKAKLQSDAMAKATAALDEQAETKNSVWLALRSTKFDDLPKVAALKAAVSSGEVTGSSYGTCEELTLAERVVSSALSKLEEQEKRQVQEEWIAEHGSKRAKRMAKEGLSVTQIIHDERLALELPGWISIGDSYHRNICSVGSPSEDDFDLLDAAREDIEGFETTDTHNPLGLKLVDGEDIELKSYTFVGGHNALVRPVIDHLGVTLYFPAPKPSPTEPPKALIEAIEALNDAQLGKLARALQGYAGARLGLSWVLDDAGSLLGGTLEMFNLPSARKK